MKPLFRWTVGESVSKEGLKCLSHSIFLLKKNYGDSYDYFICHNGDNVKSCNFTGVNFIDQRNHVKSLSVKPHSTAWKLYPPRIRLNSHEIFLDNDLIIYNILPIIDRFINEKDIFFCTQAYKRNYGNYDSKILKNQNLNTGLFGIPPFFDFAKNIESRLIGRIIEFFGNNILL